MKYETKFVMSQDAETLTNRVNAAEREGWEYVSVQIATAPAIDPVRQGCNFYLPMLVTLRREVKG